MVQVPDVHLYIFIHQFLNFLAVLDDLHRHEDHAEDDHQQDGDNQRAVALDHLADAG